MEQVSFGKPDGSHLEKPTWGSRPVLEIVDGNYSLHNLPIPAYGLKQGAGYPTSIVDGLFLSSSDTPFEPTAIATNPVQLYGDGTMHGKEGYDWAADAEAFNLFMIWTANKPIVAGGDIPFPYQLDGSYAAVENLAGDPILNEAYKAYAGDFASRAVTGIRGTFRAFFGTHLIAPGEDLSTYTRGSRLTVSKGFLKKFDPASVDRQVVCTIQSVHIKNNFTKLFGDFTVLSTGNKE